MLTKGNFTRDEWNHLLCLSNISHFSSTVCSEGMAKRTQQDSGEERVTSRWWVFLQGFPQLCHLWRQKARWREVMKVRVLGVRKLRKMIERGNPLSTVTQDMSQCSTTNNLLKKLVLSTQLRVGRWQSLVFSRVESWEINGNSLFAVIRITSTSNLREWSMIWTMLIVFLQTSSLRIRKLCCVCLRTTKQWSRWSLKGEVLQWDMFPGLTELLLIVW